MNPIKNLKEKCSCELDFIKYTLTLINNKRKKIIKYLKCIGKLYDSYAVGLNTAVFCKVNKYNKLTLYKKNLYTARKYNACKIERIFRLLFEMN